MRREYLQSDKKCETGSGLGLEHKVPGQGGAVNASLHGSPLCTLGAGTGGA
jgi:hypothetical protein